MNKRIIFSILVILSVIIITGCNLKKENQTVNEENNINDDGSIEVVKSMKAIIDGKEYTIDLENNETVRRFIEILPQELNMTDLNNNEKYVNLDISLPTNSINPKKIYKGDVMLYGDNCIVIFYESFDTQFSYTKIGHIDNLPDLGKDSIKVIFEK